MQDQKCFPHPAVALHSNIIIVVFFLYHICHHKSTKSKQNMEKRFLEKCKHVVIT